MEQNPPSSPVPHPPEVPPGDWLAVVVEKVRSLRYGAVQITVHDNRVLQIDSTERVRFAPPGKGGKSS